MLYGADNKPVFASADDLKKEVFNRFINICLKPAPAIAQKPLRKQLEDWLASMPPEQYDEFYVHVKTRDKHGLAVLAQQIVAVVRAAHMTPKEETAADGPA
jgi:hypothetical protein